MWRKRRNTLDYINERVAVNGSNGTVSKPLLRYYGGKWLLAPWVISQFPAHRIYVEPFGGAASVLLRKDRAFSEVYNDIDGEIVNLFRILQDREQCKELKRRLLFTPYARSEFNKAYTEPRDPIDRARYLMIRTWMGHAVAMFRKSGFRTNVIAPRRSVPATDWAKIVTLIDDFALRFMGVSIECRPAIDVIEGHDSPETLFYIDPPYPHSTRNAAEYRHEMSDDDHRELARVIRNLEGMVIISGYPCDLYDKELYPDWNRITKDHYADKGRARVEVLWRSPNTMKAYQSTRGLPLFDTLTPQPGPAQQLTLDAAVGATTHGPD